MKQSMWMTITSIIFLLVSVSIVFPPNLHAQNRTPQFEEYPVTKQYEGRNAPLVLSPKSRMYRTRLKDASTKKPNFAGRYILTTWGCGMECLMGAVIDAKTGKIYQLPFTICCWGDDVGDNFEPIEFRLDSKLIVFSGARNEQEGDSGKHFYKFENNRFVPILSTHQSP